MWPGETFVCLATGPSLTQEDVDRVFVWGQGRTIAINDAYRMAPWSDVLYACDTKWWRWHWASGARDHAGLKYALRPHAGKYPGVTVLKETGREGLETDPTGVRTGQNSGYQAINLAVHLGAKRIVLLGYDMSMGPGGEAHFFGEHPDKSRSPFGSFLRYYASLVEPLKQAGVEVINCTRRTALHCFPRKPLEDVLC